MEWSLWSLPAPAAVHSRRRSNGSGWRRASSWKVRPGRPLGNISMYLYRLGLSRSEALTTMIRKGRQPQGMKTPDSLTCTNGSKLVGQLLGAFGCFGAIVFSFVVYAVVGQSTGVLTMCATSSEWWASVYILIGAGIPVLGIWIWLKLNGWYIARLNVS